MTTDWIVDGSLPPMTDNVWCMSDEVLARNAHGTVRVAYVQYIECAEVPASPTDYLSLWKIAGSDYMNFENVIAWMPLPK